MPAIRHTRKKVSKGAQFYEKQVSEITQQLQISDILLGNVRIECNRSAALFKAAEARYNLDSAKRQGIQTAIETQMQMLMTHYANATTRGIKLMHAKEQFFRHWNTRWPELNPYVGYSGQWVFPFPDTSKEVFKVLSDEFTVDPNTKKKMCTEGMRKDVEFGLRAKARGEGKHTEIYVWCQPVLEACHQARWN